MRITRQFQSKFDYSDELLRDEETLLPSSSENVEFERPPVKLCRKQITLKGPRSPLETTIYPVTVDTTKMATVEPQSVNSVLLNSDPQDTYERLVVAATVSKSSTNGQLMARQTTLMPNLPGFAPLVAMIFCPYMELQRDIEKSRYIAISCGLGYNPKTRQSLFSEHDIQFSLDAEITTEDIQIVNTFFFIILFNLHSIFKPFYCRLIK